jgi:hypothetical protein
LRVVSRPTKFFSFSFFLSGPFEIHTDTAVSLSVKQVELLVCIPLDCVDGGGAAAPPPLGLLHVSALRLGLVAAAGLDRDPEISIFQLGLGQACVRYRYIS